jgi:hypothetical protein
MSAFGHPMIAVWHPNDCILALSNKMLSSPISALFDAAAFRCFHRSALIILIKLVVFY